MKMNNHHDCFPDKMADHLYRIGQFAQMNRITVKALRFYEEQGLLKPACIHPESGYRYYILSQMAAVHQITALKRAGFTLEEIASINAGADEEAVLRKKKAQLRAKIADLTRQIAVVDSYLAERKVGLSAPVLIKTIPETTVAAMKTKISSYDGLFDEVPKMAALMEEAGCECAVPEYCFTLYPEPGYKEEEIPVEICEAVTEAKREVGGLEIKTMPGVQAACIFHKGSYGTLSESYEAIAKYIEENGYEIVGAIRESYIDGVWNQDEESGWLTEIQVPVRKRAE